MRFIIPILFLLCLQTGWSDEIHRHHSEYPLVSQGFITGQDSNGKPLYLCIAHLFNSLQPGKTWEGYRHCNVAYGGKEYIIDHFEIPSRTLYKQTHWQRSSEHAVTIGRDTNGTSLLLCQAFYRGSMQPGKTWPNYNHCNISYGGLEIVTNNYSVLTHGGSKSVVTHHHPVHNHDDQQCLKGPLGKQACGYNCVRSINNVACASSPDQQCVHDNFGRISCGYDCVKSPLKVACAEKPGQNCVINPFNEVRCGKQCRLDHFGRTHCTPQRRS